jgi:CheY-like chemotaxis protein
MDDSREINGARVGALSRIPFDSGCAPQRHRHRMTGVRFSDTDRIPHACHLGPLIVSHWQAGGSDRHDPGRAVAVPASRLDRRVVMSVPGVTLLATPLDESISWNTADRLIQRCTMKDILAVSTAQTFAAMPLDRIVIDGPLPSREFLVLLATLHPSFTGDVLWIHGQGRAFLSAMASPGPRVMYSLREADIEFYVDVHGLRRQGEEISWSCESTPSGDQLVARSLSVLLAEEDAHTLRAMTSILGTAGCEAVIAKSGLETLCLVEDRRPDVLVLDEAIGGRGYDIARYVRRTYGDDRPRTIMVSEASREIEEGIDGYLVRPVTFDAVAGAIFGEAA